MTKAQKAWESFKSGSWSDDVHNDIAEILTKHDKLVEAVCDYAERDVKHIVYTDDKHAETIAYCQKEREDADR